MAVVPRRYVPPPTFTPLPYGLLSVVQARFDEPDPHWQNGITYQPLCGAGGSTYDPCTAVTGTGQAPTPPDKAATANINARGATPFVVVAEIDCSPVGFWAEAEQRAPDALARWEPWQVERTFWTGLAGGQPVAFPHLAANASLVDGPVTLQTAASVIVTGGVDIVEGLGLLEKNLADCYDGVGVIHAPMQLIPALSARGLLVKDGPRLRTWNGNAVAAGAGYPGTNPAGQSVAGQAWLYATGAVFAYRAQPEVRRAEESIDRAKNTVKMIAERAYLLGWDCCHFAVPITTGGEPAGVVGGAGPAT
jgi:hypothetical protein